MKNKKHLNCVEFTFEHVENYESVEYEEALFEELQPHSNLMGLIMKGCKSVRLPCWIIENLANHFPNLVSLEIINCDGIEYLPDLSRLSRLKELMLVNLPKIEYVENEIPTVVAGHCEQLLWFPCLEQVYLDRLPKLKAWSRVNDRDGLPQVKKMVIFVCPKLASTLSRPFIEGLSIYDSLAAWARDMTYEDFLNFPGWKRVYRRSVA
ncbi:hypothetical protein RND81_12G120900 [Saponaria officinalis]